MIANKANLIAAAKGFQSIVKEAMDKLAPKFEPVEQIAMRVPSTGHSESYDWLGDWPVLREWLGPRHIQALEAFGFTIVNKDWESTIALKKNDIEDDRLGVYSPRLQGMGRVKSAYAEKLSELNTSGFATACYDKQYFFDSDHPGAGTVVWTNLAHTDLDSASFGIAEEKMGLVTGDTGKPLGIVPTHIKVGPRRINAARKLFKNAFNEAGASNDLEGAVDIIYDPFDLTKNHFYYDLSQGLAPLILQIRKALVFQMIMGSSETEVADMEALAEHVFMHNEYLFGFNGRHNVGFGLPQLAYGSDYNG